MLLSWTRALASTNPSLGKFLGLSPVWSWVPVKALVERFGVFRQVSAGRSSRCWCGFLRKFAGGCRRAG